MSKVFYPTRSDFSKALEEAGVPNKPILEGKISKEGKPYNELFNYHKAMLKVLLALPKEVQLVEYNAILSRKVKKEGEDS